jgi:hypothetical protein
MYGGHKLQIYKDIFAPFLQLPLVVLFGLYPIFVASFNLLDESKLIFGVTEKKLKNSAICFANEDIE